MNLLTTALILTAVLIAAVPVQADEPIMLPMPTDGGSCVLLYVWTEGVPPRAPQFHPECVG